MEPELGFRIEKQQFLDDVRRQTVPHQNGELLLRRRNLAPARRGLDHPNGLRPLAQNLAIRQLDGAGEVIVQRPLPDRVALEAQGEPVHPHGVAHDPCLAAGAAGEIEAGWDRRPGEPRHLGDLRGQLELRASFTDRSPVLVNGRPQTYAAAVVFPAAAGRTAEGPRVTVQATPVAVPPGWLGCSINEGAHSGSTRFDGPTGPILIRGSGGDIHGTPDEFYYLCQPVEGNFQLTVRALTRPKATHPWAKADLMIRESLAAGARNGFLMTSPANGLHFQWRGDTDGGGGDAAVLQDKQLKVPIVLRLTRQGDTVTASYSRDGGQHFRPAGVPLPFEEPLARTVYAGLAITAHNADLVSEARFNDLRVEALGR